MNRKAIVIGAGFGGLAGALRLRARGYEVEIIDASSRPGGRAKVTERGGFIFDEGPTIITAPFLIDELFALFGRKTEDYLTLTEVDPWYRIRFDDGARFDYSGSLEKTLSEIKRFEPSDADRYLNFLKHTENIFQVGFEELGDQPFTTPWSMVRLLPKMARLRSYLSVFGNTAAYIKNPHLRKVFSFHPLLVGGNPFTTTSIYSLIHFLERKWGVHFAMGGTGNLVKGLVRLLEEEGVGLTMGKKVDHIIVENGKAAGVALANGERRMADIVVANADAPTVYQHLIDARYRKKWTDRRINRMRFSMGLFVLYFGANRTYPQIAHHEILLGPRYKGLIKDIFEGDSLPRDFSLYLHAPTRTDATMAPPGCESFYALVPVPNLQAPIDWATEGPRLRDRVIDHLEATVLPGLSDAVTEDFHVTPTHFRDNLHSLHGAGFSVQPILTQSAYFRFHNRSEDIGNLFFVGAGTQPGAGLPGVLCSAKVMERLLPESSRSTVGPARNRTAVIGKAMPPCAEETNAARIMAHHATTFNQAAKLLPEREREEFAVLYAFCRFADDVVDKGDDAEAAARLLEKIKGDLRAGSSGLVHVNRFLELAARRKVPIEFALDLLDGMTRDLKTVRIQTWSELIRYCYRVASTVGMMICYLLDVRNPRAFRFAADLGIAMQLTNIARDIAEDFEQNRIYIPCEAIDHHVLELALKSKNETARQALFQANRALLGRAERYYRSSDQGIHFLPGRARWAILTASRNYEAIGSVIRSLGPRFLDTRAYTSRTRKLVTTARAAGELIFNPLYRRGPVPLVHESGLHTALVGLLSTKYLD
ncbi:MAG: phytoene desaturase family protein [Acidobacteriota bacterium]|nr:phytoene desaturase family protein [Acidobacteriota bacterium]